MKKIIIQSDRGQSGFSLIELMIAMIVTVIITGAVYGLIASGQNSFVYEPELAARQQSIRISMDLISRDIATAGQGMSLPGQPLWVQTFSVRSRESGPVGNDFLNNCAGDAPGIPGHGPCPPSTTIANENVDDLEILANPNGFEPEATCGYSGSHTRLVNNNTYTQEDGMVIFFMADGTWTIRQVEQSFGNTGSEGSCDSQVGHADVGFSTGGNTDPLVNCSINLCNTCGIGTPNGNNANACNVVAVSAGQVITYHIRADTDGVPSLWRRSTGNIGPAFTSSYQLIARGIEDMQVQYAVADDDPATPIPEEAWSDDVPAVLVPAGAPAAANFGSLIAKVRVTLTARTDHAGTVRRTRGTADVNGNVALRGSLTSTTVVRATLGSINTDQNQSAMWQ